MRTLALTLVLVLATASSGLATPPCDCDEPVEITATEVDPHACCKGGAPEAPTAPADDADAQAHACTRGCCEMALPPVATAIDGTAAKIAAPPASSVPVATLATQLPGPFDARAFVAGAVDLRGPPPPTPRRLALIQIWRC